MADIPQQQNPEVTSEATAPSTFDPMAMVRMMALSYMQNQGGLPFLSSQMPPIQSPYGGPGMMSIPQRPASQSFDIWASAMNIPNMLTGSNYPTSLQPGFYYPRPGQTAADAAAHAAQYQSFSSFLQPINESNVGQVKSVLNSINNMLNFGNMTYDAATGKGNMFGTALDAPIMSSIMNQVATYFGAPSIASQNTIWEQRGQLGYNLARAEGRDRGMAPIDSDTQLANNFIRTMQDTFFERGRDGTPNYFARRQENLYGFDPEQASRILGVAVQGGAPIRTGTDMTRVLGAVSAVTSLTGSDAQGIQDAINSAAKQGLFSQDTASLEKLTVNLRTMAKQLKELNVSQEAMKEVYNQSEKIAIMSTGGISQVTGKPIGDTSMWVSMIGRGAAEFADVLKKDSAGMVSRGELSRELQPAEMASFGVLAMNRVSNSEFMNAGKWLMAVQYQTQRSGGDTTTIDAAISDWKKAGVSGSALKIRETINSLMQASGGGGDAFMIGSTMMQAIDPVLVSARRDTKTGQQFESNMVGMLGVARTAEVNNLDTRNTWRRYGQAEEAFNNQIDSEGGAAMSRGEIRGKGLDAVIQKLRESGRGDEANALQNTRKTKGDIDAYMAFSDIYAKEDVLNTAYQEAQIPLLAPGWSDERKARLEATLEKRYKGQYEEPILRRKIANEVEAIKNASLVSSTAAMGFADRNTQARVLGTDVASATVQADILRRGGTALDPQKWAAMTEKERLAYVSEAQDMKARFDPQKYFMRGLGGTNPYDSGGWDDYLTNEQQAYVTDKGVLPQTQRERMLEVTGKELSKMTDNFSGMVDGRKVFDFGMHGLADKLRDKEGIVDIKQFKDRLAGKENKGFLDILSDTGIQVPGMKTFTDIMKGVGSPSGPVGVLKPKEEPGKKSSAAEGNKAAEGNAGREMVVTLNVKGVSFDAVVDSKPTNWTFNQKSANTFSVTA